MSFNFERLEIYKKSLDLAKTVYKVTRSFPKSELYGLSSQLRRVTTSISANIIEGSSRTKKQFNSYLDIARGSVFECIPLIELAREEKYISDETYEELYAKYQSLSMMISVLKRSLSDERRTTIAERQGVVQ